MNVHFPTANDARRRFHPDRYRWAFTLTELLVVIGLIVLLVSILLAALGHVQAKAKEISTLATMEAFANACSTFQQEHGFYPGVVSESAMVSDAEQGAGLPQISGTENALFHLMGGFIREADFSAGSDPGWDDYDEAGGWERLTYAGGGNDVKISVARLGDGPTIGGKPYPPYFTPGDRDFGVAEGQLNYGKVLPDLLDAWGQPIMYLRRMRSVGPVTEPPSGTGGTAPAPPQFDSAGMQPYIQSPGLGSLGRNQKTSSLLATIDEPDAFLGLVLQHPALPGQARGSFMLLSAGADGVYFSRDQVVDDDDGPFDDYQDFLDQGYDRNPRIFEEFDDITVFGGGE